MESKKTTVRPGDTDKGVERHAPVTVDVMRGPLLESRHVVYGVVLDSGASGAFAEAALAGESGQAWGDPGFFTVLRSALKPWQLLPFVVDGAADAFGVTDAELALAAASHSTQDAHLQVLADLMEKTGVEEAMLRCPGHAPMDTQIAREVGADWGPRHDNCSGKHTAMVAWCRHMGFDSTGYTSPDHPLQRRIKALAAPLAGADLSSFGAGPDGCRVPTVALPLVNLARLFLLLGDPGLFESTKEHARVDPAEAQKVVSGLMRIRDAMAAHPLLVAGEGRADTRVIEATGGRVVTKVGAEAVWGGVDWERRIAFAFKAIDGGSRAVVPAALAVLKGLDVFSSKEWDALSSLAEPVVKDRGGDASGRMVVHLPPP
jgi:L-asparaginase II